MEDRNFYPPSKTKKENLKSMVKLGRPKKLQIADVSKDTESEVVVSNDDTTQNNNIVQDNMISNNIQIDNTSTDSSTTAKYEELINSLQKQLNDMKKELKSANQSRNIDSSLEDKDDFDVFKVNQDDYIKVISLIPWQLNLTTEGKGRGTKYTFDHFGQIKRIIYSDLVKIIELYQPFINNGTFYILDKRVIRRHIPEEVSVKILTKEMIDSIVLNTSSNDAFTLYLSANEAQQGIIRQMLIDNIVAGKFVDSNLIYKIDQKSDINIQESADYMIEQMRLNKEQQGK
jgi:hypothetical protein